MIKFLGIPKLRLRHFRSRAEKGKQIIYLKNVLAIFKICFEKSIFEIAKVRSLKFQKPKMLNKKLEKLKNVLRTLKIKVHFKREINVSKNF